jgi:hypothetical protein
MNYEPIGPGEEASRNWSLLIELETAKPLQVAVITIYLSIGAIGGLCGGFALYHELPNWVTLAIALLILEPIGIVSLLSLLYLYFHSTWLGALLVPALKRVKIALWLVLATFLGFFLWAAVFIAWEFIKLHKP